MPRTMETGRKKRVVVAWFEHAISDLTELVLVHYATARTYCRAMLIRKICNRKWAVFNGNDCSGCRRPKIQYRNILHSGFRCQRANWKLAQSTFRGATNHARFSSFPSLTYDLFKFSFYST